ncbi:hypothetical protein, partial [Pseudomonas sp. MWU12-3103b]|uniref:hypothetical protein n=1 Tax=Pseudomonas sp. MWU12-3103b TaxID=2928857 RepID=UPI001FFF9999
MARRIKIRFPASLGAFCARRGECLQGLLVNAICQTTSKQQSIPAHKRTPATTFKIHEPLRHNGYNALRRYLRVRQNPPAYTAMRWAYRFPVAGKQ